MTPLDLDETGLHICAECDELFRSRGGDTGSSPQFAAHCRSSPVPIE